MSPQPLPISKPFTATVRGCARCGENHTAPIYFRPFTNLPKDITHFGMCPTTDEPILMQVVDLEGEDGQAEHGANG